MALRGSGDLCLQVGKAAAERAHSVHGPEATERDLAYYFR
jgi:hypothetical protein